MTTVFLSGSRRITRLPEDVALRLDAMVDGELEIVLGDANGADRLMQAYLDRKGYRRVRVFHSRASYRNNLGAWPSEQVDVEPGVTGRAFYTRKDKRMAEAADFGLIVWDGKSEGSLANARELAQLGKKSVVYVVPRRAFTVVREPAELAALEADAGGSATDLNKSEKQTHQTSFGF